MLVVRGLALKSLKQFALARLDFERALKIDPKNEDAYYALATAAHDDNDYFEALKILERAIKKGHSSAKFRLLLASVYSELGRTEDSLEQLKLAKGQSSEERARILSRVAELEQTLGNF